MAILGADPRARSDRTTSARRKLQPDTMLALRELVNDLTNEVALYKEFKAVPAEPADQRAQRHVRGERSNTADAEEPRSSISRAQENSALNAYRDQGGQGD